MRATLVFFALVLSGCAATLPTSYSYDPDSGNALVLIDESMARGTLVILEGVDLDSGEFSGPRRSVTLGLANELAYGGPQHSFALPAAQQARAFVVQLPPGDYVIAGYHTMSYPNSTTVCYGRGTPVFRVVEGAANVVASGRVRWVGPQGTAGGPARDLTISGIEAALAALPGVGPDIRVQRAEQLAQIRWERESTVGSFLTGETCPEARTFEVVGPRAPATSLPERRSTGAKPEASPASSSD